MAQVVVDVLDAEEIIEVEDGRRLGYYVKGHTTGEELLRAAKFAFGEEVEFDPTRVKHAHYRLVPYKPEEEYDYGDHLLVKAREAGRGAFPVTVIELDW